MSVRVKICCIASLAEARLAVAHGADALGLVGPMPSGPGVIDQATLQSIATWTPPPVANFLLSKETTPVDIITHARAAATDTLQLVDATSPATCQAVRQALPYLRIVQVLHVQGPETIEEAQAMAPHVHALLLDSGDPRAAVPTFGGTGKVHDWAVSRRVVEAVDIPVFLAGGLTPHNVADAVRAVRPFGVDVCSGLRVDGALDAGRLAAFMAAVRSVDSGA
jgi:phosphoribosylanthranilate isomerase